jgi:hypothetical protein
MAGECSHGSALPIKPQTDRFASLQRHDAMFSDGSNCVGGIDPKAPDTLIPAKNISLQLHCDSELFTIRSDRGDRCQNYPSNWWKMSIPETGS